MVRSKIDIVILFATRMTRLFTYGALSVVLISQMDVPTRPILIRWRSLLLMSGLRHPGLQILPAQSEPQSPLP